MHQLCCLPRKPIFVPPLGVAALQPAAARSHRHWTRHSSLARKGCRPFSSWRLFYHHFPSALTSCLQSPRRPYPNRDRSAASLVTTRFFFALRFFVPQEARYCRCKTVAAASVHAEH